MRTLGLILLILAYVSRAQPKADQFLVLGQTAHDECDYDLAQKYFYEALLAAQATKDYKAEAKAQVGMAKAYYYLFNRDEYLHWFREHLKTVERHNLREFEPMANYYLTVIYVERSMVDSSLIYANRALKLMEEDRDWVGMSKTHTVLAELFINEKRTEHMRINFHLDKATTYAKRAKNTEALAFTLMKHFNYQFRLMKDYESALHYISQAESLYQLTNNPEAVNNAYRAKAECLIFLRDTLAHDYLVKWFNFKDSVLNVQKAQNVAKYETLFELQKIESDLELQQKQLRIEKNTKFMYLIVIISVVVLSVVAFFVYRMRSVQRMQMLISRQNEALVKEIYSAEQKERVRLARDLHDSIGQKLSVMKMLLPSGKDEELEKIHNYLDETAKEVRAISHNLIPEILNLGLQKALINLTDYYNATKKINLQLRIPNEKNLPELPKEMEVSLYRVIQELLSNITKHSGASCIKMSVQTAQNILEIVIEENGKGFDVEKIQNSKGLGWKNISARIQLINGTIELISNKEKGSKYIIKIPYHEI